jgi:hypothetical protein
MPLRRASEDIRPSIHGVEFVMKNVTVEVPCIATLDLLIGRFGSGDTLPALEHAFRLHRSKIEDAASAKFCDSDAELSRDGRMMINATDMASPLSCKC